LQTRAAAYRAPSQPQVIRLAFNRGAQRKSLRLLIARGNNVGLQGSRALPATCQSGFEHEEASSSRGPCLLRSLLLKLPCVVATPFTRYRQLDPRRVAQLVSVTVHSGGSCSRALQSYIQRQNLYHCQQGKVGQADFLQGCSPPQPRAGHWRNENVQLVPASTS
jgi:hypothetical protein